MRITQPHPTIAYKHVSRTFAPAMNYTVKKWMSLMCTIRTRSTSSNDLDLPSSDDQLRIALSQLSSSGLALSNTNELFRSFRARPRLLASEALFLLGWTSHESLVIIIFRIILTSTHSFVRFCQELWLIFSPFRA